MGVNFAEIIPGLETGSLNLGFWCLEHFFLFLLLMGHLYHSRFPPQTESKVRVACATHRRVVSELKHCFNFNMISLSGYIFISIFLLIEISIFKATLFSIRIYNLSIKGWGKKKKNLKECIYFIFNLFIWFLFSITIKNTLNIQFNKIGVVFFK